MATLLDVRIMIERYVGDTLDNSWIVQVCNDAQSDFGININIQSTAQIAIDPSTLSYPLPDDLKVINRLWLQSDFDAGIDKPFKWKYRTYGGQIIFSQAWHQDDLLNIDYYRDLKYFTDVEEVIDLEDRYTSLYVAYGQREYYDLPTTKDRITEARALREYEKHNLRYANIKQQLLAYYNLQNEPVSIEERW